jgi:2-polyprenyl-6-methoxyphenol hydroxylase-like FAD-dependent oxidoreductase
MPNLERVLVAGGGIGGLTVARALHQQGFTVELVERSPIWQATGAAIQLHGNAMRVLQALGLGDAVQQAGVALGHWLFCDQDGRVLGDADLEEVWGQVGPCICIDRPRLQRILLEGAAAVPCRLNTAVDSLVQDERRVQVGFSDGTTSNYDLVVGADGLYSTVRTLIMGAIQPVYQGLMVWRTLVPVQPPDATNFRTMLGDGCFFGITPIGNERTNIFGAVGMPRTHDTVQGRLERFRRQFAGFGRQVQDYLAAISTDEQVHFGPSESVAPEHWHRGRIVLIGDAAHASAPTMAQGGVMAMEDAYILARLLRSTASLGSTLDSYEERRKPRTAWVQQESSRIVERFLMPSSQRNPAFQAQWKRIMHDSFGPLLPEP